MMLHPLLVSNKKIAPNLIWLNKQTPAQTLESIEYEDERFKMISEAAYYRAQCKGFDGSDNVQDWLIAEAEIYRRPRDL